MTAFSNSSEAGGNGGGASDLRDRLKTIIRERSFSEGEEKLLASGRKSNFYFNMKRTMSQPEGLHLIAELMLEKIYSQECDFVGGLEMGAVPVLNAISMRSFDKGKPIPLFWIRKSAKDHGTRQLMEGQDVEALRGKTAIMVEDVTTSGGSVLKAVEQARQNGLVIDTVITVVDRMEGAGENLAAHNVKLLSIFNRDDFRAS